MSRVTYEEKGASRSAGSLAVAQSSRAHALARGWTLSQRFLAVSMVFGLAAIAAGCGSGAGSPAGPSSGGGAVTPPGATLRGTVEGGPAGSSATDGFHALTGLSGVRVSVVSTTLTTSTDASGQFELGGVPSGRVQLRFEASGIDARLELEGVSEGQSMNINVHLSSSGAFLAETEDHRNETALRGRIDAIEGSRLRVLGRLVQTDGLTEVLGRSNTKIAFSALRVGDTVEIEGTNQSDGSLYARKVKLEDGGAEAPESQVNFVGSIQSLSPFTVGGRAVSTDGSTRILDRKNNPIPFASLKVGDKLEVEGTSRGDGSVLAKKLKLQD